MLACCHRWSRNDRHHQNTGSRHLKQRVTVLEQTLARISCTMTRSISSETAPALSETEPSPKQQGGRYGTS
jgi:hypothetical protein